MAFNVRMEVTGMAELLANLSALGLKIQKKVLKAAVGDGARIILKAAKARVPKGETGLLKKSLGSTVKVYRNSNIVVGIVGPRTGFRKTRKGKVRTALGEKFAASGMNPSKYAHLVEKGRKAVTAGSKGKIDTRGNVTKTLTGKKSLVFQGSSGEPVFARQVKAVAPRPFMRPALDQSAGAVREAIVARIQEGLETGK